MAQFQVLNPLGALAGVQGAVSQGQTIRQQRQQNRLSELMEPYKMQQAQMQQERMRMSNQQLQGTISDEDRVRLGRDAQLYVELFGPDLPETLEEADARHKMAVQGMGRAGVNIEGMPEGFDPGFFDQTTAFAAEFSGAGGKPKVGAQEILADGTVIQSTSAGPRVFSADGRELKGDAAAQAVRAAREFEVENESAIYGGRRRGTLGADIDLGGEAAGAAEAGKIDVQQSKEVGLESFQNARQIRASLPLYDEAIQALENGANTGAVASLFPTIQAESKRLENIQNRLGLTIIQSTTFGALSEAEMRLAMETAVPTGLDERQLAQWLKEKKAAQMKAAEAMENAAAELLSGKKTLADLAGEQVERNRKAAKDMTDDELLGGL